MQNRPGGMGPDETRNLIIAMALAMAVFFAWDFFVARPQQQERAREAQIAKQLEQRQRAEDGAGAQAAAPLTRQEALARSASQRVRIETPAIDGSILLQGARFDDLHLRNYRETVHPGSPEVTLLSPEGAPGAHDAFFGWEERDPRYSGVGARDVWTKAGGGQLGVGSPITLTFSTGDGLEVSRRISVDENFMFTITDTVRNASQSAREIRPFGTVRRDGMPERFRPNQIVHQGLAGVFGPEPRLHEVRYEAARKHARDKARGRRGEDQRILELTGPGGWLGISDHYWLTALVPDQAEQVSAYYDARPEANGEADFRAAYRGAWRTVQPGQEVVYTQRLFAGAKEVDVLRAYQSSLGLPDFDKAVDWGNFFILTRPYFDWLLHPLGKLVGSFGLGILLTTIVVKLLLFPIVFQSNIAMTKLRKVQPKMKEIQERFAADRQRQQQEMIRLYQTEKINPVAGCVPILLQIPVFYALYKVLTVTIEMRHEPFWGWIKDLSAPDPLSIFNLFGLLPYEPSAIPVIGAFLMVGPWALMYGATMWALQALNPPPTDPTQAMIFRYMPLVFVFLFASFPVGLVIYWTWSNILSIVQQYVIMRTQGVETELDKWIGKRLARESA